MPPAVIFRERIAASLWAREIFSTSRDARAANFAPRQLAAFGVDVDVLERIRLAFEERFGEVLVALVFGVDLQRGERCLSSAVYLHPFFERREFGRGLFVRKQQVEFSDEALVCDVEDLDPL